MAWPSSRGGRGGAGGRGGWESPGNAGAGTGPVVQRLRAEVEELVDAFTAVPPRLTDLDNRLREIGVAMRDLEVRATEQDAALSDATGLLKRLTARVEWLERNIRLQAATAEAELDDIGPEEIRLAEVAEAGQVAQAGLLSGSARSGLESAVQAHADAVAAHARHRQQAIEACTTLAQTLWTEHRHREAVAAFETQVQDAAQAKASIANLAAPALRAAQQLSGDVERRQRVSSVVSSGAQARATLALMLRSRLAEAVGTGALLPPWFTSVLGPIPPAQDTRPWMDAGTDLLAYRVTYSVSDPVLALGPRPAGAGATRQLAWYEQLTRQLRELQS